ncbi:DUF5082 family protein [Oceanobacillus sp. 1P07AA]|uniref:YwqH-like family protein n=1 Tax=Oceanobacillus sp. 1P07AA TaxID=3132293 RepID=UPI0039A4BD9B
MDEFSINTELNRLQHRIYLNNIDLQAKQDDLERLRRTLNSLESKQGDFHGNNQLCTKPECSKSTFFGSNADNVEGLRDSDIIPSYNDITDKQLHGKTDRIRLKIEELTGDISALNSSINTMESNRRSLIDKRSEIRRLS